MSTGASIVSVQPYAIRGGPSVLHLGFLGALDRSRHVPHVVLPRDHPMRDAYDGVAASVHELPAMPTIPRTTSPIALARYLRETSALSSAIASFGRSVDAQLVHTFSEAFPAGPRAARRLGVPAVVQGIGMSIFSPRWVGALYGRFLRRTADRIVCCQALMADAFADAGVPRDRLDVVYNAVDAAAIEAAAARGPSPEIPPGRLAVGTVAGLDPRKGHLNFIGAAARVVRERDDVDFWAVGRLAGDPDYRAEVDRAIAEHGLTGRFHLVGEVDNASAWIAAMDVYCIPSLSEALSVAGLEAMALARPVVATRVGGNPEAVADGETGLLCAPADPDALARGLLELLGDEPRRRALGAAGRRRVDRCFSLATNVTALQDVFDAAGQNRGTPARPRAGSSR